MTLYNALYAIIILDTSICICDGILWMYGRNRHVIVCMIVVCYDLILLYCYCYTVVLMQAAG